MEHKVYKCDKCDNNNDYHDHKECDICYCSYDKTNIFCCSFKKSHPIKHFDPH